MKKVDFLKTIAASDLKVSGSRHLIKYTQYIKKRKTYIFADNLSNFKDVHFKLAGYIDYVYH